jgi:hypothetical protein
MNKRAEKFPGALEGSRRDFLKTSAAVPVAALSVLWTAGVCLRPAATSYVWA